MSLPSAKDEETKEYLQTFYPALTDILADLCSKKPEDPYYFLAVEFLKKSEHPEAAGLIKDMAAAPGLAWEILSKQDSTTSSAIIDIFGSSAAFNEVSKKTTEGILARDAEDEDKLAAGIKIAVDKEVIPADIKVDPINKIDVIGKTADAVADEMLAIIGEAAKTGCVITLQGLSGTGKGTTVATLKNKIPGATTWSNGNIFRSLTLLAATWAEQNEAELSAALTPENLDSFVKMLTFGKFNEKFDVQIKGLGIEAFVSDIQNTTLKEPRVGKNIPTVAGVTQGEVINFVKGAVKIMADDGVTVLVEGRAQTLNYIPTPLRFELVLSNTLIIGQRRAAQRLGAMTLKSLSAESSPDASAIKAALDSSLDELSKE